VIFGADRQVAGWVTEKIEGYQADEGARALGVIKGDKMAAGVVYERWNGVHVEAAIAAEPRSGWADRRTLHAIFYYPFVTLDCRAISVSVPMSNLPSLNLATKLGFEVEALIKYAAHDGSTLVVLKMFRENCKWIGDYGKEGRKQQLTKRT
jgi:hypothetical protein